MNQELGEEDRCYQKAGVNRGVLVFLSMHSFLVVLRASDDIWLVRKLRVCVCVCVCVNYSLSLYNVQTRDTFPCIILAWTINDLIFGNMIYSCPYEGI